MRPSDEVMTLALGGAIALLVVGVWFVWTIPARRRPAGLRLLAERRAFSYVASPASFDLAELQFSSPGIGAIKAVSSVLRGVEGEHELLVCDCILEQPKTVFGTGGQSPTTLCLVRTPLARLPPFFLRGLGTFDDPNPGPGETRVKFVEDEAFSRGVRLRGVDCEALRALFSEPVRRQLLPYADSTLVVQGDGERLVVHFRQVLKANKVEELISRALEIRRLLASPG